MKNILLIATGGTISGISLDRLDMKDYVTGVLSGENIIKEIPEINGIANVKIEQLTNISSTSISNNNWIDLKNKITFYLEKKSFDGIVITHGTNTIEETAFFLNLTLNTDKPIVLVGSMRPFSAISSDAKINVVNAIRVACSSNSYGKGVLVVHNDNIVSARDVNKVDTYNIHAFESGKYGYLGSVDPDGEVEYYKIPIRRHTIDSSFAKINLKELPIIPIILSYIDSDGELIKFASESKRYKGLVIAGMGAGRVSNKEKKVLYELTDNNIIIVMSSRVGDGRVVKTNYHNELNLVTADNLSPQKARILLMLSLLLYDNKEDIQKVFKEY